ncbi:MAG: DUF1841 family protein [Bacteroidetes bacterium]|nr:DUF1841 family protein [Bacteroidota bacterium]MBU1421759.1 DUF1841 family protein [Bacteroidota bacterium]MBU2471787.1 DUF1841 family protein [Bacteroidota bacterium]MBU2637179.1 DUF1841 family protein [Bacteroidota bacterium]
MEDLNLSELRALTRENYHNIWQRVKAGEELEGEEKIIGELMKLHKEFYDEWESTDFDYEYNPDTEINPFLHIMLDTVVMNQITKNDPPQAKFTYNKLTARGHSHLETVHKIAAIIVGEIWDIMKNNRMFDEKGYVAKLKKLK